MGIVSNINPLPNLTLMNIALKQVINFVYSLPQPVGIVFCPRHRLPKFNTETRLLEVVPNLIKTLHSPNP